MSNGTPDPGRPEWLEHLEPYLRFFVSAPATMAGSLYRQLPVDEGYFVHVSATAAEDARAYYLYAAADEVCKADIAIKLWASILRESPCSPEDDPQERHLRRLVCESISDEQRMWQRKLIEWLANLVCFGATNREEYYRLYLVAEAMEHAYAEMKDLKDWYDCDSGNARVGFEWARRRFAETFPHVQADRCWFLRRKEVPQKPQRMLQTASTRLKEATKHATPDERLCLGVTYGVAYGAASRSLHPAAALPRPPVTVRDLELGIPRVALLCLHVVNRAHHLAGIAPSGSASSFRDAMEASAETFPCFSMKCQPAYEAGDLVVAMGHLAEVVDKRVSTYGLESYLVRFLVRGPLPEMPEDWVPAPEAVAVLRKSWSRAFLRHHWGKSDDAADLLGLVESSTDEDLFALLRRALIELEKRGIPLDPLIPPE